jgi:hypothetical protein
MAESWDTKVLSYALGDPGGDNKQLFLLRAPSAAFGGGLTILSGEAVQGAAVANSLGVGGTTFTLALHKYTSAGTPAVYGTIAAAIGGTAQGWGAGRVHEFTIDTAGSMNYLSGGEWLVLQYNEVNAGNPVLNTVTVAYIQGRGAA